MASPTALSRRPSGRPQRVLDTISPEVARSIGTAEAKLRKILNSAKQKKKFSTASAFRMRFKVAKFDDQKPVRVNASIRRPFGPQGPLARRGGKGNAFF